MSKVTAARMASSLPSHGLVAGGGCTAARQPTSTLGVDSSGAGRVRGDAGSEGEAEGMGEDDDDEDSGEDKMGVRDPATVTRDARADGTMRPL